MIKIGGITKKDTIRIFCSPLFFLTVLAVINLLIALFFVRYPLQLNGDAPSYLAAMQLISGQDYDHAIYGDQTEVMLKTRVLTTPLMLYASLAAGYLVGSEYGGMFLINLVFYFLIIIVFYKLVCAVYENRLVATLATILFFTNYCLINYGTTYRTDLGGWFFFLLAAYFAIKYFKDSANSKFYFFSILASSIGILFKECGALGLVVLVILILFLPLPSGAKFKKIFGAVALFFILPLFYQFYFYWQFHFSYLDRYLLAVNVTASEIKSESGFSLSLLIKVLSWLFSFGWLIFFWGLYQEYKNLNWQRLKIFLALLPASLSFVVWPALTQRLAFVLVPLLAMISGFGLSQLKRKYLMAVLLLLYIFINYWIRNLSIPDLLHLINI
jgi:4-amino-4-deoxy-L-arabinose transferase-like glycosyltransferase